MFKKKISEEELEEQRQKELQERQDMADLLSDLTDTEQVVVKLEENSSITSDIVLDDKNHLNKEILGIVGLFLGLTVGVIAALLIAFFITHYSIVFGVKDVQGEIYANDNFMIIEKNYYNNFEELRVGDEVYYSDGSSLRLATVKKIKNQVVILEKNDGTSVTVNYEKVKYISTKNKEVQNEETTERN